VIDEELSALLLQNHKLEKQNHKPGKAMTGMATDGKA